MNKMRLIESLKEIVGFQIGLYTNDGEYIEGILSEIKDDFLIIKDKKHGTFFFNIDKIQAFSKNTRKFVVDGTSVEPYYENSLMEIIDNYQYSWVTVHCQNKLTFTGVLSVIEKDHIVLTMNDEKLYIQKDHIITFRPEHVKPSRKPAKEEQKKKEQNHDRKMEEKKDRPKDRTIACETASGKIADQHHKQDDKKDHEKEEKPPKEKDGLSHSKTEKENKSVLFETPRIEQIRSQLKASLEKAASAASPEKDNSKTHPSLWKTSFTLSQKKDKKKRTSDSTLKIKTYYGVSFRKKKQKKA